MMMETTTPTKFVIIGGAGKIAKYHFEAIEKVGGEVVGVIDPALRTDILGELMAYASIDEFRAHAIDKCPEYFVILSPNHLHVEHTTWALKYADVICEKPLAISTSELAHLKSEESLRQTKVHPIMQMRKHPILAALHKQFQEIPPSEMLIDYVLPRDSTYNKSWQGDPNRSGGLAFHIGIHLLDFLVWTLGEYKNLGLYLNLPRRIEGYINFKQTYVFIRFSTELGEPPRREITFDHQLINLSSIFPLHTLAYQDIIAGHPLSISDIEPTIKFCEEIRNCKL